MCSTLICLFLACDNNDLAHEFLAPFKIDGSCSNMAEMCDFFVNFIPGLEDYETVADLCKSTCNIPCDSLLGNV